ncbi:MAG: hypothetical protein MEQ07_01215 [Aquimonas sp.]|nr:hypothetical protein [Aquimonas sp.]
MIAFRQLRSAPCLPRLLLVSVLLAAACPAAACAGAQQAPAPTLVELLATSDRGDAFDRSFRVRVHSDGCLALRRPAFHREPGEHVGTLDAAALQGVQSLAAQPALRAIDPAAALVRAQLAFAQAGLAEVGADAPPRATFVSHPTWYRLRFFDAAGEVTHELRMESILQHAELHPQDPQLATLAAAVRQLLELAETTPTQARNAAEPQP